MAKAVAEQNAVALKTQARTTTANNRQPGRLTGIPVPETTKAVTSSATPVQNETQSAVVDNQASDQTAQQQATAKKKADCLAAGGTNWATRC